MKIGDIRIDKLKDYEKYIWTACIDCGRERWVRVRNGKPEYISCRSCMAKKVYHREVILYPIRSVEESYMKDYGENLENNYDIAENIPYLYRIFCMDCEDFETCKGRCWRGCPNRAMAMKVMKEEVC